MGKKIVFLNLADMHEKGLAFTTVNALRKKYPRYSFIYECWYGANTIYQIDLFNLFFTQQSMNKKKISKSKKPKTNIKLLSGIVLMQTQEYSKEILKIKTLCATADKIMFAVHGEYDNTTQGFVGLGWEKGSAVIGNYKDFALLISHFLNKKKEYKIALIVCYGARSQNFKLDHEGNIDPEDIKSSFAYKFFKELCTKYKFTLTARTGAIEFETNTGRSLVQTELALSKEIEERELQKGNKIVKLSEDYEQLQKEYSQKNKYKKFLEIVESMKLPNSNPKNETEKIIKEHNEVRRKMNEISQYKNKAKSKYGKFVYIYKKGKVRVYRKYEQGEKVMTLLYKGNL